MNCHPIDLMMAAAFTFLGAALLVIAVSAWRLAWRTKNDSLRPVHHSAADGDGDGDVRLGGLLNDDETYHCPVCDLAVLGFEINALIYDLPCPRCAKNGLARPSMISCFRSRDEEDRARRKTEREK